ncbi:MAG: hypothetical protein KY433_07570, partial [Actinobacteria bacterium]|nr:hypothetical protein [Actinomycetota bacterium]
MATAAAGLVLAGLAPSRASAEVREMWEQMWDALDYVANALLFLLIGLVIGPEQLVEHLGPIALAAVVVLVARALAVVPLVWLLERLAHVPRLGWRNEAVLVWGGLRGGVALALLAVANDHSVHLSLNPFDPSDEVLRVELALYQVAFLAFLLGALVAAAVVALVAWAAQLPLGYVRGYVVQHDWGLSTQGAVAWFVDRLRSLLVAGLISMVAATVFFGLVRWQPRSWFSFLVRDASYAGGAAVLLAFAAPL